MVNFRDLPLSINSQFLPKYYCHTLRQIIIQEAETSQLDFRLDWVRHYLFFFAVEIVGKVSPSLWVISIRVC